MKTPSIHKYFVTLILFLAFGMSAAATSPDEPVKVPEEIAPVNAPFDMPDLKRPEFPDNTFNIKDYGAEAGSDGKDQNTKAIHAAIEDAHKAGGGKVLIPEGEWWTGPIHLMSHINLHVAENAVVHFSKDKEDYLPVVLQRPEGVQAYNYSPLIYARDVENIALTGKGTLNGHGRHWWEWAENNSHTPRIEATKVPLSRRTFGKGAGEEGMRPNFIVFWKSSDILVEGITLKDSPMWNVNPVFCENIIVRDITVLSKEAPNGDGINPSSCKNVLIEYNHFETGDDAVVLKSGLNEEGLKIGIPTKNVVVRNYKAVDVQTGSGGIVFGSETSGGIENVYVHDAYFEGCDRGIRFKSERGRGNSIENIYIHDIQMKDLDNSAINFNAYYHEEARGAAPLFKNINIRDIQIDGVPNAIIMNGLPEKWLEDFTFRNIDVKNSQEGARIYRVKNLTLENVTINAKERAMEVSDVFEFNVKNLNLDNQVNKTPFLLDGKYTGAVNIKGYPVDHIELGENLPENVME